MRSGPLLWPHSYRLYAGSYRLSCHMYQAMEQDTVLLRPHGAAERKGQRLLGRERLPGVQQNPHQSSSSLKTHF